MQKAYPVANGLPQVLRNTVERLNYFTYYPPTYCTYPRYLPTYKVPSHAKNPAESRPNPDTALQMMAMLINSGWRASEEGSA